MNPGVLFWSSSYELFCAILSRLVLNDDELCWASGYESRCVMLSKWVWIIVFYGASGCESWRAILSQWLWIRACYAMPVVVKRGILCWASGYDSWCVMLCKWLWIICVMQVNVNYNYTLFINAGPNEWVSDCCLTPTRQFCSYIMARIS